MSTQWIDHLVTELTWAGSRRRAMQVLGASAVMAGAGLSGAAESRGKKKHKQKKRKQKQGAPPAPQDFLACHDVVVTRCLVGDTVCIAAGDQCCTQLAAGRTADAVRCLVTGPLSRVP